MKSVVSALLAVTLIACARGEGGLSQLTTLTAPPGPASAEPNLGTDADGNIYLSWIQRQPDSTNALLYSVMRGNSFDSARVIARGANWFVNWADFPMMARLSDGTLAAHWLERNGAGKYAYGVRIALSRNEGRTWSPAFTPHRDSAEAEHGFVSLIPMGLSLGAVWLDGREYATAKAAGRKEADMQLWSTVASNDGTLSSERIVDPRTCDCCQTSAVMTDEGPIVAYRDRSPDEIRDIYISRLVRGEWTEGKAVHADNWKVDFCPVNGPSLSARGRDVAIAWFTAADSSPQVKVAFSSDAGATFGAPVRVDLGQPLGRVDIALLEPGRALVSWLENSAVQTRIVSGKGLGDVTVVTRTGNERSSGFPHMAVTGKQVVFAWTEPSKPSQVRVAKATLR